MADIWLTIERERVEFFFIVGDAFVCLFIDELDWYYYDFGVFIVVLLGGAVLLARLKE